VSLKPSPGLRCMVGPRAGRPDERRPGLGPVTDGIAHHTRPGLAIRALNTPREHCLNMASPHTTGRRPSSRFMHGTRGNRRRTLTSASRAPDPANVITPPVSKCGILADLHARKPCATPRSSARGWWRCVRPASRPTPARRPRTDPSDAGAAQMRTLQGVELRPWRASFGPRQPGTSTISASATGSSVPGTCTGALPSMRERPVSIAHGTVWSHGTSSAERTGADTPRRAAR
jgi:hypothetical protein